MTSTPATAPPTTTTRTLRTGDLAGIGPVPVTFTERGRGRPVLLLHGGAGPRSVTGFADLLAQRKGLRAIVPTHPGFAGTARPEGLDSIRALAAVYTTLLEELDLHEVTVIGNSIGGWIAAEIALTGSPRLSSTVLLDAAGLDVPDHPIADFFSLSMTQIADLSYHDPDAFRIDPTTFSPDQQAAMVANGAALALYAGTTMTNPHLRARLAAISVPTLVLWGDADRIIDVEVGRAYAAAIPGARFELLPATGHLPQLETPEQVLASLTAFTASLPSAVAGLPPAPGAEEPRAEEATMTDVKITGPDGGEVALSGPTRLRILEDGSTTEHRLGVAEIVIAPHTDGPPQHRHAQHDEGFYVVSGIARFTVGADSYEVGAGTFVMVPPGAPHTFANPSDETTVLLNTFTPDRYVQYFRDLHDMIAAGRPLNRHTIGEVMSRYATEVVGDS